MTRILAIDPGSEQSAWLLWDDGVIDFGILPNAGLVDLLRSGAIKPKHDDWWYEDGTPVVDIPDYAVIVIEQIESYGMAVGREVFATVHWAGRFTEAARPTPVVQLPRRSVKLAICGDTRAKDANIRAALLDRFGGKAAAVGTKKAPGPLYGISRDVWSALAIAVTYAEGVGV